MSEKKAYWFLAVVSNLACPIRVLRFKHAGTTSEAHRLLVTAGWQVHRVARESEVPAYDLQAEAEAGEQRALEAVTDWEPHLHEYCNAQVLTHWIAYYSNPDNPKVSDWDAQAAVYGKAAEVARIALGGVRRHWQQKQTTRE